VKPPQEGVDGPLMSLIAGIGVVVNVILAFVLGEHHVHLPGGDHGHDHDHSHDHGGHGDCNSDDHDSHDHDSHDHDSHDHDSHDHDSHDHDSHSKEHDHKEHDHGKCKGHDHAQHEHNETSPLVISDGGHEDDKHDDAQKQTRNVNLHAAYLHVLGDLAQSVAVLLGGLVIWWNPEWHIVDPILTLGFCVLVFWSTIGVLRSSIAVLLEETPAGIDWRKVYNAISAVTNVADVHDLHIWCISHGEIALSVHCTSSDKNAIANINKACLKFGIKHSTIQVNEGSCTTCSSPECCTYQMCDRTAQ